jgi:hypothetical protein
MTNRAQHRSNPGVTGGVFTAPAIFAFGLRLRDALRLAAAAVVVVFPGHGGERVEHHRINRREHAGRKIIGQRRQLPACRKIKRDHTDLLGVKFRPELAPVRVRQAREAVDLLDQ